MEVNLETISKRYFSSLNSLAEKITADIEKTPETYQDLWHTLNKNEKNQIIDNSIINSSAATKYADLNIQTLKENCNTYSWFTKSQLNLFNQHDQATISDNTLPSAINKQNIVKNEISEIACPQKNKHIIKLPDQKQASFVSKTLSNAATHKSTVLKPKTPPPPPPPKISAVSSTNEDAPNSELQSKFVNNDIPKTGFDFLDNW